MVRMSRFEPLPLGQRIPARVHGVSCSLPTMEAVIGYEEKNPRITAQLTSGYPRFVLHPYVRQLSEIFRQELNLRGHTLWLTCSPRAADELKQEMGGAHVIRASHEGLPFVAHVDQPELNSRAKVFLQNTGGFLSSREAEDHLVNRGAIERDPEVTYDGDALGYVTRRVAEAFGTTAEQDVVLTPGGMSAFTAAWRSALDLQNSRGRTVWLQLGWLYLDTMALMARVLGGPTRHIHITDVTDTAAILKVVEECGDRLGGVVTEAPTNPLVQTADLAVISDAVWKNGGLMLVDPSLLSPANVDILRYADLGVASLTKYFANEGDVIAGAIVINSVGPDAAHLRVHVAKRADSLYRRDLERLAAQLEALPEFVRRTNETTLAVLEFLQNHPAVKSVYWARHPESRAAFDQIARHPEYVGSLVSFTVKRPLTEVYDRMTLPKGPSFGMKTSLISPYVYLAHYDLVTTVAGRQQLAQSEIEAELLRLSIGAEPADEIIEALRQGLD